MTIQDAQDNTASAPAGDDWLDPKGRPENLTAAEMERWQKAITNVRVVAARDSITKSEVARRSAIPMGTFSPWYDGNYPGRIHNVTERVEKWLRSVEDRRGVASHLTGPGFIETRTARELIETLVYAQVMPEMVVITLGPGMGKTMTAQQFAGTRPHVVVATMRPTTSGVHAMLCELALTLNIVERNSAKLDRAIGERLKRNGRQTLLIIDEAQNLVDNAVNQLRYLLDEWGCGIALLGNEELYSRFGGQVPRTAYAQLHRRIGKRMQRLTPLQEDIDAIVEAWNIDDPDAVQLARAIGKKPGALSQITKTLTLAGMLASGAKEQLNAEHIRKAWRNRAGEDILAGRS